MATKSTDGARFWLINDRVRRNAIEAISNAPPNSIVSVGQPRRTADQNAKMWAMLTDVARAKPGGRNWTIDTWKDAFMHSLGHQVMFAEGLDGSGPFPVGLRTSRLTVPQMIDLIDCIYAWGTEHGVLWTEAKSRGFMGS